MGFWSSLGKLGSIVAAPFTGGASLSLMPAIDAIGGVASGVAEGRARGRAAEADYGLQRDALGQRRAAGNINADSDRIRQAILLKMLQGGHDAQVTPPAHIAPHMASVTGGPRISSIHGRGDIANAALPRIMESLFSGQHLPGLTPTPQANAFDKILSGVGTGAGFIGALGQGIRPKASPGAKVVAPGQTLPGLRGYRFDQRPR